MSTFHLINFGCRASQADGAALKKQLMDAGLCEVDVVDQSRVAVLNTCTVTANADAEVRQVVRRIHRANPQCQILVTGCYAQRAPNEIAQLAGVKWVVGNSHKHNVAELLRTALGQEAGRETSAAKSEPRIGENSPENHGLVQILSRGDKGDAAAQLNPAQRMPDPDDSTAQIRVGEISEEFHFAPVFPDDRTRPTLKIQDGCGARCSFCIIPTVRGPSRSLPADTVIEQIRELERAGFMEVVLSGINLGSYGRDLGRQITFLGLLERILKETTIARLRISSIEPMDVSAELIQLVAGVPRTAQHFHVPLQSGCDRILRQMNRRYWARQYAERIHSIREQIPNCGIGADVMVGFPGESDKDHLATIRLLESLPLTYVHVFPYSSRPSTPAAAMPSQVNGRVAHERAREIRSLIAAKHRVFLASQVDRTLSVLTLDELEEGTQVALSSNYLKVALPGSTISPNTLFDVRVGRADANLLYAYDPADSSTQSFQECFIQA
ncbi:MAG TPA: tRNA (N(6)-L-threonylcarbamoyladenosine(37)-C(2))-methylthiotransferase MtaB [Terriglobia bacterium]|nr:tRNA (N(6)-L-threonylcarbamoyladenosine(37)-C(2))-methylthiotransferase MtaB [Terriglobia bacterium]